MPKSSQATGDVADKKLIQPNLRHNVWMLSWTRPCLLQVLDDWSMNDYREEYHCVLQALSEGLETRLMEGNGYEKDDHYLYHEDRIVVPEAQLDGCLQCAHLSSSHTGCNYPVDFSEGVSTPLP